METSEMKKRNVIINIKIVLSAHFIISCSKGHDGVAEKFVMLTIQYEKMPVFFVDVQKHCILLS